jgi:calcineurin-like phosphoesterase family protein
MSTFFIADTHFNHSDIINYCNRPFTSSQDHTNRLIENWNSVVKDEDTVFVLGDFFFFHNPKEWDLESTGTFISEINKCIRILFQLKGHKRLIKGNHDVISDAEYGEIGFEFVSPYPIIYNNFFILSHEPLLLSQTTPYFNLYGHVHNDTRFTDTATSKCVSVERLNYTPISLERVYSEIEARSFNKRS